MSIPLPPNFELRQTNKFNVYCHVSEPKFPTNHQIKSNPTATVIYPSTTLPTTTTNYTKAAAIGSIFDTANSDNGSSKLGTLNHWNSVYSTDLQTFKSNTGNKNNQNKDDDLNGNQGEIWYGLDVTEKMVDLVSSYCITGANVLDVGTGNGDLLCRLVEHCALETNQCPSFLGTDYSPDAVTLARAVLQRRGQQWAFENDRSAAGHENVEFIVDNILQCTIQKATIDVFLDKGTLDALSCLYDDHRGTARIHQYMGVLASLGKPGISVLALTSANFTRNETKELFLSTGWEFVKEVKYPTFSFGGGTGVHVNTMLYRLR